MDGAVKTLVELYDKEAVENVLGACIFEPEMVVYICDERDSSMRKETAVDRLFKSRGLRSRARFYYIDTSDPARIHRTLEAVVRDYPGCVFDCTGGKDLVLLAAGVFCREKGLPAYYIDTQRAKFVDLGGCEALKSRFRLPQLTAEDIFSIAGARLVGSGHFAVEELGEDLENDARRIWPVVFRDPAAWGKLVGFFQAAGDSGQGLSVDAPHTLRVNRQTTAVYQPQLLHELEDMGVIHGLRITQKRVRFSYKSALMRRCLQNHGVWLELYGYLCARRSGAFGDVRTSVVVDWDNARGADQATRNEIDILLVQGITPVFISCKMGAPTPLALSEIRLLSEKFGGESTRTVLLTAADVRERERALVQRARDLGVLLIDRPILARGDLEHDFCRALRL